LFARYNWNDQIKEDEMDRVCRTHEENIKSYRVLVGKPEGNRPLGRPRRKWKNNVKIDVRGIGWGVMDWIDLAKDRDQWRALVNTAKNLRVP
jgi:hypothetical protein